MQGDMLLHISKLRNGPLNSALTQLSALLPNPLAITKLPCEQWVMQAGETTTRRV